jgi:hypothetical protein
VDGKSAQQHQLHARGTHEISGFVGELTIPDLMGQTDLPWLCGVILLGTVQIGHPDRRPMRAQDLWHHALSPTGSEHMDADLGVLKHPFPLLSAVHAGTGLITTNQTAAAQPGEDFRQALVQPAFDRLEHVGQTPFTDVQPKHLRKQRRQALITARMRVAQGRRQTLDRGPKWGARFHPRGDRGHRRLPTAGTPTAIRLHARDDRLDGRQLDLVIDSLQRLPYLWNLMTTMGADFRLGDEHLVGVGVQGASTTGTPHTGLATHPLRRAGGGVRLARVRGRYTGIPCVLNRLLQLGFQFGYPSLQALHRCPQRDNEGILVLFR